MRWLFPLAALAASGCDSCDRSTTAAEDASPPRPPIQADASPMNAGPLPSASVAKLVNPDGLPPYTGPTGSVEGTIAVVGEPPPANVVDFSKCPDARTVYEKQFRVGAATKDGAHLLRDAVVVVTGYKGGFVPERNQAKVVTIQDCAFSQRTVTMTFGQRLDVKNDDKQLWAPFLEPQSSRVVVMMAPPGGDPVKIYPSKAGHYLLVDREHPYAVADLYTFLHPLHASTDANGHYRIDDVPIGKVNVNTMHPRFMANATQELEVQANVVHRVDLVLKYAGADAGVTYDAGRYPKLH